MMQGMAWEYLTISHVVMQCQFECSICVQYDLILLYAMPCSNLA